MENKTEKIQITEIDYLESKLLNLERFFNNKKDLTRETIIDWTVECDSLFHTLGITKKIIEKFLSSVDLNTIAMAEGEFGAFMTTDQTIDWHPSENRVYPVSIAFKMAKSKLMALKIDKNLVPQWLIDSLSEKEELSGIYTLLNAVESGYEKRSSKLLITSANTLLESILDINDTLKEKGSIGPKLQSLVENENLRQYFGISRDMVIALNNSKTIRNEEVVHPKVDLDNNLPLLISISYAYLVVLTLIMFLATGNLETQK